jgi:hypothetical protein
MIISGGIRKILMGQDTPAAATATVTATGDKKTIIQRRKKKSTHTL